MPAEGAFGARMATLLKYAPLISAVASILMLGVWAVYLALFWRNYRQQHRAKIVIGLGEGVGLDALCLVSNMGSEPIHIEGVIIAAEHQGRRWDKAITGIPNMDERSGPMKPAREGPLKSGEYIVLGTFRDLLEFAKGQLAEGETADPVDNTRPALDAIAICVVADLSSESGLVYARRRFVIRSQPHGVVFRPEEPDTRRLTRARDRREMEEILRRDLEETAADGAPSGGGAPAETAKR